MQLTLKFISFLNSSMHTQRRPQISIFSSGIYKFSEMLNNNYETIRHVQKTTIINSGIHHGTYLAERRLILLLSPNRSEQFLFQGLPS